MALPVAWVTGAITSYFHPGDEGGIFVLSTIAGSWVCFLMHNIDHLRDVLWIILLTGAVILAALGFMMDRFRLSKRAWGTLFGLCFVVVLVLSLRQYPSLERAISKNGSVTAYVAGAWNIGLYLSIVSALIIKGVAAAAQRIGSQKRVDPVEPGNRRLAPRQ